MNPTDKSLLERAEYAERENAELLTLLASLGTFLKERGHDGHPLYLRIREKLDRQTCEASQRN